MSFNPGVAVLDGLKRTFKNIPLTAFQANGTPSNETVLYGDGVWRPPTLVAPLDPAFDGAVLGTSTGVISSGTPFGVNTGAMTGGAFGIALVECIATQMDLGADVEVVWGSTPMVSKGGVYQANNSTYGWLRVFVLDGIPDGNQFVQVTATQAGKTFAGKVAVFSYRNVVDVSGLVTAFGTGNPTITVPAVNTNDITWGAFCTGTYAVTSPLPGVNTRVTPVGSVILYAGDTVGGGVFSGTSSTTNWAAVGLNLIAAQSPDSVDEEIPVAIHAATSKTTPVDGDELALVDSEASSGLKKLTWAALKSAVNVVARLDNSVLLQNNSDHTKQIKVSAANISTATTRTANAPDVNGSLAVDSVIAQASTYTLTSTTSAQQLFNAATNGAVTLNPGTYRFKCVFALSNLSSTSGTFGFGFGGSATIASQAWFASGNKPSVFNTASPTVTMAWYTSAAASIAPSNVNTFGAATIEGIIRISAAGTLIPQTYLSPAAAAVVQANSFCEIKQISNSATAASVGDWS